MWRLYSIFTGRILQMTKNLGGNASHSLSAVVAFKGRDLILPKGIDSGEMLAWASAEELLAHHLELAANAKAFWKDGFVLYTLHLRGQDQSRNGCRISSRREQTPLAILLLPHNPDPCGLTYSRYPCVDGWALPIPAQGQAHETGRSSWRRGLVRQSHRPPPRQAR